MSDLVVNVRQISSYAATTPVPPGAALLLQNGGLGSPYISATAQALVATALNSNGSIGIGTGIPTDALMGQVFTATNHILPLNASMAWNCYFSGPQNAFVNWGGNISGLVTFHQYGWQFQVGTATQDQPPVFSTVMVLGPAGNLQLPLGTLQVARDPSGGLDVATMQWVQANTVASFMGRIGAVQLTSSDVYAALCLDGPIATQTWVCQQLNTAFQAMLEGTVVRWNGRSGNVFLTLSDITCVFFQPGQQPIAPTPPTTSDDNSIATTAWVQTFVSESIAGDQGLATQAWVKANTVASFNGRIGAVSFTTLDGTSVGLAPTASPNFTGIPTAPTASLGQATAQIATTAFVQQAIVANTTGVVSFNTRTGIIELEAQDIYDAGGALQASPAFTGVPTAPTAPLSTATTQLATTAFVMNEVAATTAGVSSFNTRTGAVTLSLADITGAGGAPIASPAFSGTPTTPTPINPITGSLDVANTNWVVQYVSLNSVASFNGRTGAITLTANDVTAVGGLANPSPAITGVPTAPTAVPGTSSTQLATTAFVQAAIAGISGVTVSTTPPPSPYLGQAWFNNTVGVQQLMVYTGAAFVPSTNLSGYVPLAGNVNITGPLSFGASGTVLPTPAADAGQVLATLSFSSGNHIVGAYSSAGNWIRSIATTVPAVFSSTATGAVILTAPVGAVGSTIASWLTALSLDPLGTVRTSGNLIITTNASNGLGIVAGSGQPNARMLCTVGGQQWSCGALSNGSFNIADETNGVIKLAIAAGAGGAVNVTGALGTTGNIVSPGQIFGGGVNATAGVMNSIASSAGANSLFQLMDQSQAVRGQLFYEAATGNINLNNAAAGNVISLALGGDVTMTPAAGHNFLLVGGVGYQNGQTTWSLLSDARIKTVARPYTQGLQAVLALNPIVYTYKGNHSMTGGEPVRAADTATEYIGLVAQEAEAVMPEMVGKRDGFIDGQPVADLRDMNTTALSYALVNAIKELFAMVTALQAAKPA